MAFGNWLHVGRSYGYKIFEANTVPELTAEQYKALVAIEQDRIKAVKEAHEKIQRRSQIKRGRPGASGDTISIRTTP